MDLPNLLNKLKSTAEEPKEFLAIEIGFDAVKTAIWQSTGVHTEVVSVGSIQSWSSSNTDDLVTAIDTSLADAQGNNDNEPNQVIFGLPETWVDSDGIAEIKKPVLKTICQKLGLKAIGFVVTTEAMVHHLREVEGSPPSAILIQIASSEIATSLIYLGNLEATQVVERSTNIATDVEEGLARIPHTGHLPSRIIVLTNLDDPEPIKQELISYDWQKKLEFLHIPKVESLPKEWSIKAVAVAGGAEVIETIGFANVVPSVSAPSQPASKPVIEPPRFETVTLEEPPKIPETVELPETPESSPTPEPPVSPEPPEKKETLPEETINFGFTPITMGEATALSEMTTNLEPVAETEFLPQPTPTNSVLDKPKKLLLGFGSHVKSLLSKSSASPKPASPIVRPKKSWLIPVIISVGVLIVLATIGFLYYQFPHALVNIYVGLNPYQQQLTFTVDPEATEANAGTLVVTGKKLTIDKTGTKTVSTTGTKLVGDRAKGKIIIYNRTNSSKNLSAGTIVKTSSLKYTLDTAVTIASASSKENSDYSVTTEPSKTEVAATAADIGDQYNVAKDTEFAVSNFSSDNFFAVSTSTFTGGSSRKVAAVAKEDTENVKKSLIQDLQAQIDQSTSQDNDPTIRQVSIGDPKITTEEYSAKIGEEAAEITLQLAVTQTIYQYNVSEVSLIAQQVAQSSLPPNVNMQPNSTQVNIVSSSVNEDDKAIINAQIVLQYIPRIEVEEYKGTLVNLPINQIDKVVNQIPNFQRYNLEKKWLILNRLPINPKQLSVRITPTVKE